MKGNQKAHWDNVYSNKTSDQVSWTQVVPQTSLDFIHGFRLSKSSSIIDIGGGDSNLVDFLIQEGFQDITVLDISEAAINKAKARLGERSELVKWVVSDITKFKTDRHFDLWHDRATFHFLTSKRQIGAYLQIAGRSINNYMVVGTFSENGPDKCSGLPIKQYTEDQLQSQLKKDFEKIRCIHEDHITPFQTKQNFLFCSFKKQSIN
ncbi:MULTISPECIES: class I SAM-dependent methyltransferase [unclassified Mucilaginibacter]|uniref:class I SAM-dependent methyltransferase n=1 Tax=unclassified Mucilaginibacter TaxID=2617802 RepID=UPI002AC935EE|nr:MULTISPECIES: class I SAM-dependent methyltransferase [unclassified Mucilaginibacter]MEB0262800.1 class I SAM-dependent methyltransferase [Mucilaginibacter sp. 10I4]MEB0278183.1 class I SAM-dependent methyltransferase [Mucilaginibacter sp. 10B2]MEB0302065.1 class I SAM-dependent methyltransferase [Mucilaginibacter sp. 5C4]WPX23829.1 class I SAM-dependent methyltransferase [Mucilaginibacter sp. 5C4]